MNENLDLTKILANVPKGTRLYCVFDGYVRFKSIDGNYIVTENEYDNDEECFYKDGRYSNLPAYSEADCILFPSKEQRDWSKFVAPPKEKVVLHPFDKVLVRDDDRDDWMIDLFMGIGTEYMCMTEPHKYCIPYNEETAHLLGTTDAPAKEYEITFDKSFKNKQL